MKTNSIILTTIICFYSFLSQAQINDSTNSIGGNTVDSIYHKMDSEENYLGKNQLFLNLRLGILTDHFAPFGAEYLRRLTKSNIDNSQVGSQYKFLRTAAYFYPESSRKSIVNSFKISELLVSGDSVSTYRYTGTKYGGFHIEAGIERQNVIFDGNGINGLQLTLGWFGYVGYNWRKNQYIHSNVNNDSITSALTVQNSTFNFQEFDILGNTMSKYLKFGGGLTGGFDYIFGSKNSKQKGVVGIHFSGLNIGIQKLVQFNVQLDNDQLYEEELVNNFTFVSDWSFRIRGGLYF